MSERKPVQLSRNDRMPRDLVVGQTYLPVPPFLELSADGFKTNTSKLLCTAEGYCIEFLKAGHGGGVGTAKISEAEYKRLMADAAEAIRAFNEMLDTVIVANY